MGKILLADDSAIAQRMGKQILSAEGFEVFTVSNGQAAAKILKQFVPDLILADIFMPGRNGYELCQLVKSDPELQHIPVVLIIGKMEPYDEAEGRKARADAVITKPLESSSLIETVQRLLASVQKPAPPSALPESVRIEEPPEEESAAEEVSSPEIGSMWTPAKDQLEIPDEFSKQPFSVFGDLLDSSVEADTQATPSPETPEMQVPSPPEAFPVEPEAAPPVVAESAIEFEEAPTEQEPAAEETSVAAGFLSDAGSESGSIPVQAMEEPAPPKEFIPESPLPELQEAEDLVWKAEPAAATEDDEKLFEPPPPVDREGLAKTTEDLATPQDRLSSDPPEPAASAEVATELLPVSNTLPDAPSAGEKPGPAEQRKFLPEIPEVEASLEEAPTELLSVSNPFMGAPPAEEKTDSAEQVNLLPEIPEMEAAIGEDTLLLDPVSVSSPPPEEAELETTTAVDSAAIEKLVRESAEDMMPQITDRIVRTLDTATIKELVRESLESMMPQIVDRISRSVEIVLRREQD